jgi:hypothetical protein
MTNVSNIPKPDGGFYQVGDKLETKEQAIAFAQAVGWEFFDDYIDDDDLLIEKFGNSIVYSKNKIPGHLLPLTIVGFLPEHTAKPNPPLTFEEALELGVWWSWYPKRIEYKSMKNHYRGGL